VSCLQLACHYSHHIASKLLTVASFQHSSLQIDHLHLPYYKPNGQINSSPVLTIGSLLMNMKSASITSTSKYAACKLTTIWLTISKLTSNCAQLLSQRVSPIMPYLHSECITTHHWFQPPGGSYRIPNNDLQTEYLQSLNYILQVSL
jgi:hypothetical protein